MKKKFIVIVDNASVGQQNAVTTLFADREGVSCWHHFAHVWLLTAESSVHTSASIMAEVQKVVGRAQLMVLDIPSSAGGTISTHMPAEVLPWLQNNWYAKPH